MGLGRRRATAPHAGGDLRLEGLTKSFGHDVVVDAIDLVVPKGSFFALIGPSGCGKTTTLRMVAGLARPDAGRVLVGEDDLTALRPHERPVNTVFQSYALFPHLSVRDNVAFGPRRRGISGAELTRQVDEALALADLGPLAGRMPAQLSGGQQQRVALARAIVNRPEVLLLDEPLGALDLKLRRQMQVELKRIQAETGLTFVHVTHDQEEAMGMADQVAVMRAGRIEQMGAPAELYELPRTAFVSNFLGQSNNAVATVRGTDGDQVVLDLAGQPVRVLRERCADLSGGTVVAGVRPEKVRLFLDVERAAERPGTNVLARGYVRDVSFTGVATQYVVDVPGAGAWTVYEQNRDVEATARPGDVVALAWDLRHTFTLPGSDDPMDGMAEDLVEITFDADEVDQALAASGRLEGRTGATAATPPATDGVPR